MKNSKLNLAKVATIAFLLGSLGLAACNKGGDGGGGAPAPAGPVVPACVDCGGLGSVLLSGVQAITPDQSMSFLLAITGSASFPITDPQSVVFYGGPATLTGNMHVSVPLSWMTYGGTCTIPVGDYAVSPLNVSSFGWLMMYGGAIQATGPVTVTFQLSNAVLYNPDGVSAASPNNHINMTLMLNTVNGLPCSTMISTY